MIIDPGPGETPLEALLREQGKSAEFFEWDESNFVSATPEEMRAGLIEAMRVAREKGWIPQEDPGCQCLICRAFRSYTGDPVASKPCVFPTEEAPRDEA